MKTTKVKYYDGYNFYRALCGAKSKAEKQRLIKSYNSASNIEHPVVIPWDVLFFAPFPAIFIYKMDIT